MEASNRGECPPFVKGITMKHLKSAVRAGDARKLDLLLSQRGGCTREECFTLRDILDARPEYTPLKGLIDAREEEIDTLEELIDAREESLKELAELDEELDAMREEIDELDETFRAFKHELYELKRPIAVIINGYVRRYTSFVEPSFKYVDPEVHTLQEAGRAIDARDLKFSLRREERSQKKAGLPSSRPPKIRVEKPWALHQLRGMPLAQLLNIIAMERALRPGQMPSAGEKRALNELELFLMGKSGYSPILHIPKEWDRLWRIRMGWRQRGN